MGVNVPWTCFPDGQGKEQNFLSKPHKISHLKKKKKKKKLKEEEKMRVTVVCLLGIIHYGFGYSLGNLFIYLFIYLFNLLSIGKK